MTNVTTKSSLPPDRCRLLELMQRIYFGRIEQMIVRSCDPVLSPLPRVIREVKFGAENGPWLRHQADDFLLKEQLVELFDYFDVLQNGVIDLLEVKHGLPFRLIVADVD